ncbi:hypothetical protein HYALB_00005670 [Hymenoscyphus albidus]|uniref:O-methyltransferase domain-containing protein n=1 Tax=Hymenoscyphus albidus TaxID=595503 RepID=A0A9N9LLL1_9HELO|nr:hypothetical protein HYALB_00005670 [Hymenoscyphus albidus]
MSVSQLIQKINEVAANPPAQDSLDPADRIALLEALDSLRGAIESPVEATARIAFGAYEQVGLRLGIDMGIFDCLATVLPAGEMEVTELAEKIDANTLLVSRVMRLLSAMGLFKEVSENKFANGPLAPVFADGSPFPDVVLHLTTGAEVLVKLPEYLKNTKYKNPMNAKNGPFQFAKGTDLHYLIGSKPSLLKQKRLQLRWQSSGDPWFDFYPVEERFAQSSSTDTPLMVDIGGSLGNDLAAFHARFPSLRGSLVLEELPEVLDSITDLDASIVQVKHDFFLPQPKIALGAKAYFLSTILHDWPDKEGKIILAHVRSAMNEESVLLINENALPDTNVPLYPAKLDFLMMSFFSGIDRTVKQFRTLLEESGFELVEAHQPKVVRSGTGYIFEAILKR